MWSYVALEQQSLCHQKLTVFPLRSGPPYYRNVAESSFYSDYLYAIDYYTASFCRMLILPLLASVAIIFRIVLYNSARWFPIYKWFALGPSSSLTRKTAMYLQNASGARRVNYETHTNTAAICTCAECMPLKISLLVLFRLHWISKRTVMRKWFEQQ